MIVIWFPLIFLHLITLTFSESTRSIFIHQENLSPNLLQITCSISGINAKVYNLYLYCPLSETNFCYKDCSVECRYEDGECLVPPEFKSIEKCNRNVLEDDHVQIQYIINTTVNPNNLKGEWYCSFAGLNSKSIRLNVVIPKRITTSKLIVATTTPQTNNSKTSQFKFITDFTTTKAFVAILPKPSPIQTKPQITPESSVLQNKVSSKQETDPNYEFTFRILITKYQVVIGIICLLTISVLLNFIFYIRDSLIKQFIDNIKHNIPSSRYLLCFICQNESNSILDARKQEKILSKDVDYLSNAPSSCSKNDSFNVENHRPLIANMYSNSEWNANVTSNMVRSKSLMYQDYPRPFPMNYEQVYMTTPRGLQPYSYNPYLIPGSNLEISTKLQESFNQKHSKLVTPQMINQGSFRVGPIHNKIHASENDIDLIKHCDQQLP